MTETPEEKAGASVYVPLRLKISGAEKLQKLADDYYGGNRSAVLKAAIVRGFPILEAELQKLPKQPKDLNL